MVGGVREGGGGGGGGETVGPREGADQSVWHFVNSATTKSKKVLCLP